jgi:hypothetical protein
MYISDKIFSQLLIGVDSAGDVTCHGIRSSWRVVKSATSNSYWLLKRHGEFERERERERERTAFSRRSWTGTNTVIVGS